MLLPRWLQVLARRWFVTSGGRGVGRRPSAAASINSGVLSIENLEERLTPSPVPATDIVVTSNADQAFQAANVTVSTLDNTKAISLIDAINAANNTGGGHTIILQANTVYSLTAVNNDWYGPDGLPAIDSAITIQGNGATIARDTNPADNTPNFRLFYVSGGLDNNNGQMPPGSLTLQDLTLSGGVAKGGDGGSGDTSTEGVAAGGGGAGLGGAIFSQGMLNLTGVTLTQNLALGGQGGAGSGTGVFVSGGGGGLGGDGGSVATGAVINLGAGGGGFSTQPGGSASGSSAGNGGSGVEGTEGGQGATNISYGAGGTSTFGGNGAAGSNLGGGGGGGFADSASSGTGAGTQLLGGSGGGGAAGGEGGGGGAGQNYSGGGGAFGGGGGGGAIGGGGGGGGVGGGGGGGASGGGGGGGFGGGGGGGYLIGGAGGFGGGGGGGVGGLSAAGGVGGFGAGSGGVMGGGGGAGLGGGIFVMSGSVIITDSTLTGNTAAGGSGGQGATGGSGYGGALFSLNGNVTLFDNNFSANSVAGSGGIASSDVYNLGTGKVSVTPANVATTAGSATASFSTSGQTVVLNATVLDQSNPNNTVGEGTVTFTVKDGGGNLVGSSVQGSVVNGTATANFLLPQGTSAGSYTILVSYTDGAGNFTDGGDTPSTLTVNPVSVTTVAGPSSAVFSTSGQPVTLSATVTDTSHPGDVVSEGTVTFTVQDSHANTVGTPVHIGVSGGSASTTFTLPAGQAAGSYTILVSYSDSAGNFADGGDTSSALTVSKANVNTSAGMATATFSTSGQSVNLSASVSNARHPADTVNEGTVTFTVKDNQGNTVGSPVQGAVSGGTAGASFALPAGQAAGSYTILVTYSDGAGNFADGGDTGSRLTVSPASVTISAGTASASFSTAGQPVTLSATVSESSPPGDTVNEGTVTFTIKDTHGNTIGNSPITASVSGGTATAMTYSLPPGVPAGSYTILVSYSDSGGNYTDGGDTSNTLTINPANVTTSAGTASALFSTADQPVTLMATVTDASHPADTVNEGDVTFTVQDSLGNTIGKAVQGAVSGGTATANFTLPQGTVPGSYTILVSYTDSLGNFTGSGAKNAGNTLTVNAAKVTTAADTSFARYSTADQAVNLCATVTDTSHPGDTVNEGTVTFTVQDSLGNTIGTSVQGSVSNGCATASFTLPGGQAAGPYIVLVSYTDSQGNFTDDGTADSPGLLAVKPAKVTTTADTSSAIFSTASQLVTLNSTVTDNSHSADTVNEGEVTFTVQDSSGNTIGTPVVGNVVNGSASADFTLPAGQAAGSYTVLVSYDDSLGNFSDHRDVKSTLTVSPASVTTTAGTSSAIFSTAGQPVTLSATVSDSSFPADIVNEGTVTFTVQDSHGNTIGTSPITVSVSNGTATAGKYNLPPRLPAGNYTILVSYSDSAGNFVDGGDTGSTLTVNPANVTTSAGTSSAVFSTAGQPVILSATVTDTSHPGDVVNEGSVTFTVQDSHGDTIGKAVQGSVSGGTASASFSLPAGLAAGSYKILVSYSDSAGNFTDSGDTGNTLTVTPARVTTTAGASSIIFSTASQLVTLNATVSDTSHPADTVSEGVVTFTVQDSHGNTVGSPVQGNVNGGSASANFSLPAGQAAGAYTIRVSYSDSNGNFTDNGDTSSTLTVTSAGVTATAQTSSAVFSTAAQNVNLRATVVDVSRPADVVNEGTVTFTIKDSAGNTIGTSPITASVSNGTANVTVYNLPAGASAGSYTILVTYSDATADFADVGDSANVLTITPAKVTATAGTASTVFTTNGQTLSLQANVSDTSHPADTVSEGVVTFTVQDSHGNTVGSPVQGNVNSGSASANFSLPAGQSIGSYTIVVHYSDSAGNFTDNGDSGSALTVSPAATSVQLIQSSWTPNYFNLTVTETVTAHVNSPGTAVNGGTVTFQAFGHTVSGNVDGNGNATAQVTLPIFQLPSSQTVNASYTDGPGDFSPSSTSSAAVWPLVGMLFPTRTGFSDNGNQVMVFDIGWLQFVFTFNSSNSLILITISGLMF
jgi:hypothetical protein